MEGDRVERGRLGGGGEEERADLPHTARCSEDMGVRVGGDGREREKGGECTDYHSSVRGS